jgi:hypothetical protein
MASMSPRRRDGRVEFVAQRRVPRLTPMAIENSKAAAGHAGGGGAATAAAPRARAK